MKKYWVGAVLGALAGFVVQMQAAEAADSSSGHFGLVAALDLEFGGDDVAEVRFTNGKTQTVHAGQGVAGNLGLHYRPAASKFDFAATIGYKFVTTAADNADIHLDRVVFKLLGSYDLTETWWIAAGPVWHTGVHFKGDGYVPDVNFSDSTGFTAQIGWRWISLGFTNMSYSAKRPFRGDVDASNIGFTLQWRG